MQTTPPAAIDFIVFFLEQQYTLDSVQYLHTLQCQAKHEVKSLSSHTGQGYFLLLLSFVTKQSYCHVQKLMCICHVMSETVSKARELTGGEENISMFDKLF